LCAKRRFPNIPGRTQGVGITSVLFVCADNSATSIIAEAILRAFGGPRFKAHSAGLVPAPSIDPLVVEFLKSRRLSTRGLRTKSLLDFNRPDATLDYVITVCERAAMETPRNWPGNPVVADWRVETLPRTATQEDREDSIRDSYWALMRRIKIFTSLPHGVVPRRKIEHRIQALATWQ
jgi:arsenate reductase